MIGGTGSRTPGGGRPVLPVAVPGAGLWPTALPFSLSAPVPDHTLRITVKALGGHTRRIAG